MARLNEPVVSTETIESLKRKFMRQNRDIARANSTQSLRIRNLENETSRLLAENLALREQILRLQGELENRQAQRESEHTGVIRSHLESKLLELSALVASLGEKTALKKSLPQGGKICRASPNRSPNQRPWGTIYTLGDDAGSQDGRLPPILENKSYPRRSLECQQRVAISDAAADTTDSPEIGPPPVSQFVDEDPVKIDLPSRTRREDNEDLSGLDPVLSINLEQRKKRKDSICVPDSKRASRFEPVQVPKASTGSLTTGAKRKLGVRDCDDPEISVKPDETSPDDFKFTRVASEERLRNKALAVSERPSSKVLKELAVARGAPRDKQNGNILTASNRKILAPKSVNDSPRKNAKGLLQEDKKGSNNELSKVTPATERSQSRGQGTISIKPANKPPTETIEVQPEPETPASADILSPNSSQPSTTRAESRDTPPPPDLGLGTEGLRPSRRSRNSISYAEPNLRDKMRRPTKELVDAVTVETKVLNHGNFVSQGVDFGSTAVKVKAEPEGDDAWKRMPIAPRENIDYSPLRGKAPAAEVLPRSITAHRRRRESILQESEAELHGSRSGSAVAAFLAENKRSKAEVRDKIIEKEKTISTAMAKLDIYEFRGSSPPPAEESSSKAAMEDRVPSRFSRRHSSISRDVVPPDDGGVSGIEISSKTKPSTSRLRQKTLGSRNASLSTEIATEEDRETALKKAISTPDIADSGVSASSADKVSMRRRSMML